MNKLPQQVQVKLILNISFETVVTVRIRNMTTVCTVVIIDF